VRVVSLQVRSLGSLELRNADERIVAGVAMPYGVTAKVGRYRETFARGAFQNADPERVPLMVSHRHAELPIGRTVALTDDSGGLRGEWKLSETRDADEVLALASDGVPLGLSVGFVPDVDRWSPDRSQVTRVRARLGEISVVGVPAYAGAMVTATRSVETPRLSAARLLGRRQFSQAERDRLAKSGAAMPDGSFPIRSEQDLRNAIAAIGRAGPKGSARYEAVRRHIIKRARALGLTDQLPDDWRS
jgi:HK97 family phage prohead protease